MSLRSLAALFGLSMLLLALLAPAGAQAAFGIAGLSAEARNQDGTLDLRAGSHPYEYEIDFTMNLDSEGKPDGTLRDVIVELPPGLVGNPRAVPLCSGADSEGAIPHCPGTTQIGVAQIHTAGQVVLAPVYNLTPPFGALARIGFSAINLNSFQDAALRSGADYGVVISDTSIPTDIEIEGITETIWGVPADPAHDPQRTCYDRESDSFVHGCPSDAAELPFLSLPTACDGPLLTAVRVDSLQAPDVFLSAETESLGEGGLPEGLSGCGAPPFDPSFSAQPGTAASDSPTGLHVGLHIPQNQNPRGIATAHLKDTAITLPQGLVLDASAADGLGACSPAQIGLRTPAGATPIEFTPLPAACPANSKIGTVKVTTPAIDHPLPGSLYLAEQGDNPFGSLIALYLTVHDPTSGVLAKLAGRVEPDPISGRLQATFSENPRLPFEDFEVDLFAGPKAALTTPTTCGTYTSTAALTPWTSPQAPDVLRSDPFAINAGPDGGRCADSEAQLPNAPGFEAGTAIARAGGFSPLVLRLRRENGSQRFSAVNMTLPPGLSARLAGVAECSETQIAQAQARSRPTEGSLEKQSPSCPQAARVGVLNVGVGSGNPFYVQGNVYLAGPYEGAPLSLAIITPAVAGPFDLGTVVLRAALHIDEETAQAIVTSDPIPTILQGIPLDVRRITVIVDRSNFTINPTSCEVKAIAGTEISTTGALAPLQSRFQVGGCGELSYSPKLSLRFKGATHRRAHPKVIATLKQPPGQANTARARLTLPQAALLDQGHIGTVCTRVQFAAETCPPDSVYGRASAKSPLLDYEVSGPVYLRSSSHELPDLVADLHGPPSRPIRIALVGRTDSAKSGALRNTFEAAPDVPVSRFRLELFGGRRGLVILGAGLCSDRRAGLRLRAHSGKVIQAGPNIRARCGTGIGSMRSGR